ncbi:MAG TPA: plastocyanin/azurin family copper-binding protein [Gemmatimonadales bacterium]|jgi:plastocyanin
MKRLFVGVLALAGVAVVACFSERGSGPGVTGAAECRVPVTVIDSMHYIVAIRDFGFHPATLTVPVGATVTWVNCEDVGQEPHTTTSDTTGIWSSADLNPGNRFSHTFATPGLFPYHCIPHESFMRGEIVVQ